MIFMLGDFHGEVARFCLVGEKIYGESSNPNGALIGKMTKQSPSSCHLAPCSCIISADELQRKLGVQQLFREFGPNSGANSYTDATWKKGRMENAS